MKRYLLLLLLILTACGAPTETAVHSYQPVAITNEDECAVCGMSIQDHPGPKGQLYLVGSQRPAKFCSTVDFFIYALQPEHENRITQGYVHDMAAAAWQEPDDATFIPAQEAWFVIGHRLPGGMGPTLASFRDSAAAQTFIEEHGGRMLPYSEVDLEVLQELHQSGFISDDHRHQHE